MSLGAAGVDATGRLGSAELLDARDSVLTEQRVPALELREDVVDGATASRSASVRGVTVAMCGTSASPRNGAAAEVEAVEDDITRRVSRHSDAIMLRSNTLLPDCGAPTIMTFPAAPAKSHSNGNWRCLAGSSTRPTIALTVPGSPMSAEVEDSVERQLGWQGVEPDRPDLRSARGYESLAHDVEHRSFAPRRQATRVVICRGGCLGVRVLLGDPGTESVDGEVRDRGHLCLRALRWAVCTATRPAPP